MSESQKTRAYQILTEGLVQGVSYRRFVQRSARALGLSGWTRNLNDGRVESYVVLTDDERLEALLRELRKGPPRSRVEKMDVFEAKPAAVEGFEIRPDAAAPEPR